MALYGAKADGRGTYRFFEPEMDARMQQRRELEMDLRQALINGEFELHYQPLVNLQSNDITGFEALLRWNHPTRGRIPPAEFIPIAEETGLIIQLGDWVLRRACEETASWPQELKIAVNLSPAQLKSRNLVQAVVGALAASSMPATRLQLEITESLLMQNTFATLATLHKLRELGVQIAMDDFGTGYSSLSYLRSFPFDKIKDRPHVHQRSHERGRTARHRACGGQPGEEPAHDIDRGRGRDAPAAGEAASHWLHRDARPHLQPGASRRRDFRDISQGQRQGKAGRLERGLRGSLIKSEQLPFNLIGKRAAHSVRSPPPCGQSDRMNSGCGSPSPARFARDLSPAGRGQSRLRRGLRTSSAV